MLKNRVGNEIVVGGILLVGKIIEFWATVVDLNPPVGKILTCTLKNHNLLFLKIFWVYIRNNKDFRELSWMSHGVMRFWFLLNFLLIFVFFDILASLSISRVFPSGISGRWKSSRSDIPRTIIKFDYIN